MVSLGRIGFRRPGLFRLHARRIRRRLFRPFRGWLVEFRKNRTSRGVARTKKWISWPALGRKTLTYALGVAYLGWLTLSMLNVVGWLPGWPALEDRCRGIGHYCSALIGFASSILAVALSGALFLALRMALVTRPYRKKARKAPAELVPTSGTLQGEVVGRDDLCRAVMENIRDRDQRRVNVIVGGAGTGKTTALVHLTWLLRKHRAFPVPIRLRDASEELDFKRLAFAKFLQEVDFRLVSGGEGERVWRQLLREDKVVVLADGLDEALVGKHEDRDNLIRLAISRANESKLPVVIASRPHDSLNTSGATIMDLEPLSEFAALTYLEQSNPEGDLRLRERLQWIVEHAGIADLPIYLQITRELVEKDLLEKDLLKRHAPSLRGHDQSGLREELLFTYIQALMAGQIREELPLNRNDRRAAIDQLSALACVGLEHNDIEVEFSDLEKAPKSLLEEVDRRHRDAGWPEGMDVRLAASIGAQMDLVEIREEGVRFVHSIIQAYLASRLLGNAIASGDYLANGLNVSMRDRPAGRELLIALVLYSRARRRGGATSPAEIPLDELVKAANRSIKHGVRPLDIFAALMEIDSVSREPQQERWATELLSIWPKVWAGDRRTLEEARLGVVRRFGEAARQISRRRQLAEETGDLPIAQPAYRQLFELGLTVTKDSRQPSYAVRHAIGVELGAGGDDAFRALRDDLQAPWKGLVPPASASRSGTYEQQAWHRDILCAWVTPLLVGSSRPQVTDHTPSAGSGGIMHTARCRQEAEKNLSQWVDLVGKEVDARGRKIGISLQIALAQGFIFAANRGPKHVDSSAESRTLLYEQGLELLKRSSNWFAQLTLIHALTLFELSDRTVGVTSSFQHRRLDNPRGSRPKDLVNSWVEVAGSQMSKQHSGGGSSSRRSSSEAHPFVREAGRLAVRALETRRPERYIWIDPCGVVCKVGSQRTINFRERKRKLWIPPSTGWSALDSSAQLLVGDILLLLNLADRGMAGTDRERRLERANRAGLPPCLEKNRQPLDPLRSVGAPQANPGSNCLDGCHFQLCPYPPKGSEAREDFSEAFCRKQQRLYRFYRRPSWQEILAPDVGRFWGAMAERARLGASDNAQRHSRLRTVQKGRR